MDEEKTLKELLEEAKKFGGQLKWKAKKGFSKAKKWCVNHKNEIAIFGPVIGGSVVEIIKITMRSHTVKEKIDLKERYIYDRSQGHYYRLRRKPKNSEWLQIEQRKNNGESLGQILNDMRLLV